jgi:uncharacterized membrane protein YjjP (DUF1212 family)
VQEITEYFKENFKKFGILVNSAMVKDLLGLQFQDYLIVGFAIPVLWAIRKFIALYWELKEELDSWKEEEVSNLKE